MDKNDVVVNGIRYAPIRNQVVGTLNGEDVKQGDILYKGTAHYNIAVSHIEVKVGVLGGVSVYFVGQDNRKINAKQATRKVGI